MIQWETVEADPQYQSLDPVSKGHVKAQWFKDNIAFTQEFQSLSEQEKINTLNNWANSPSSTSRLPIGPPDAIANDYEQRRLQAIEDFELNAPSDFFGLSYDEQDKLKEDFVQKTIGREPKEEAFQQWYAGHSKRLGLSPDPDDPEHFYDYRAAYEAGAEPGPDGHWPSKFKLPGHPNRFVKGIDTITGKPMSKAQTREMRAREYERGDEPLTFMRTLLGPEESLIPGHPWETGQAQVELGLLRARQVAGEDTPEIRQKIADIKDSMPEPYTGDRTLLEYAVSSTAEMLPIMIKGTTEGAKMGAMTGMTFAAAAALIGQAGPQAALPEELVTVPLSIGSGYMVGHVTGSLMNIAQIEAGLAYDELLDLTDENGNKVDPTIARAIAGGVGVVNGLIEASQIGTLAKTIPGVKQAIAKATRAGVVKALRDKTIKNLALKSVGRYGAVVASETGQELLQETTNILGDYVAAELSQMDDLPQLQMDQIIQRYKDTAKQSAAAFAVMAFPGSATSAVTDARSMLLDHGEENETPESLLGSKPQPEEAAQEPPAPGRQPLNPATEPIDAEESAAEFSAEELDAAANRPNAPEIKTAQDIDRENEENLRQPQIIRLPERIAKLSNDELVKRKANIQKAIDERRATDKQIENIGFINQELTRRGIKPADESGQAFSQAVTDQAMQSVQDAEAAGQEAWRGAIEGLTQDKANKSAERSAQDMAVEQELLNNRIQRERIPKARQVADENPGMRDMLANLHNAPGPETAEQAVRQSKVEDLEKAMGTPITDATAEDLLRAEAVFKHDGRKDMLNLVSEIREGMKARAAAVKEAADKLSKANAGGAKTLGGFLKSIGGINPAGLKSDILDQRKDASKAGLLKNDGLEIEKAKDVAVREGWMLPSEDLMEILSQDPEQLRRGRLDEEPATKFQKEKAYEEKASVAAPSEMPPDYEKEGAYKQIPAGDLEEGTRVGLVIDGAYDDYEVVSADIFGDGITVRSRDKELTFKPTDRLEVRASGIKEVQGDQGDQSGPVSSSVGEGQAAVEEGIDQGAGEGEAGTGRDVQTHAPESDQVENAAKAYDYSSTQVDIDGPAADELKKWAQDNIPDSELEGDGREDRPHITVKYGLHTEDPGIVEQIVKDHGPIKAILGKVSVFKNDDADIVKVSVRSKDLRELNKKIAASTEHTDTFKFYDPHVTLAYVKKGEGEKYAKAADATFIGKELTFNSLTFSGKDGKLTAIPLSGSKTAESETQPGLPLTDEPKIEIPDLKDSKQAVEFGEKATPEQVKELERLEKQARGKEAEYKAAKDFSDARTENAFKAQLYREALEASKGEHPSQREKNRPTRKPIAPKKAQDTPAAKNVAQLLYAFGLENQIFNGEDFHRVFVNKPYINLVIERHLWHTGDRDAVFFTHYLSQNGDTFIDSEMIFTIDSAGRLHLVETATQDTIRGGELRGRDQKYANMFAKNLIDQGWEKATEKKDDIEEKANEAATSDQNDTPEPTDDQKKAGNYKKGHVTVQGISITIENPAGSTRSGTDSNGKAWSVTMKHHYGYFKRSEGKDGDQIDVIIGPSVESHMAFIVDQVDPKTRRFDEHKVVMGARDIEAAKAIYLDNYEPGWDGLGDITEVSIPDLKDWISAGKQSKPYANKLTPSSTRAEFIAAIKSKLQAMDADGVTYRLWRESTGYSVKVIGTDGKLIVKKQEPGGHGNHWTIDQAAQAAADHARFDEQVKQVPGIGKFRDEIERKGSARTPDGTTFSIQQGDNGFYVRRNERGVIIEDGPDPRGPGWTIEQARDKAVKLAMPAFRKAAGKPPAPKFAIGDRVRPRPGSGISDKNAGVVQHIRRHEDGSEWVKTDKTGNMHFAASDWELDTSEPAAEGPVKEPWQMTREQYLEHRQAKTKDEISIAQIGHVKQVKNAVATGKDVPIEVLHQYRHNVWAQKAIEAKEGAGKPGVHANQLSVADLRELTSSIKGTLKDHGVHLYDTVAEAKEALEAVGPRGEVETFPNYLYRLRRYQKEQAAIRAEQKGTEDSQQQAPGLALADKVYLNLAKKQAFTWRDLFAMADEAFGGTQAQGAYTPKDAYDAMELGVNQLLADQLAIIMDGTADQAQKTVLELKELTNLLPSQTKRTEEQEKFQQFSTPPGLSFVANWVANISEDDVYLEPSAGIGGLAVFGKLAGAKKVFVNELSDRRAALLEALGFDKVFHENAEQLDNVLPGEVKPTVIVMNPPFSATAGRVEKNKTKYGAQHVEQALARLEPGGRLVAIVGRGMADDRPTFRDWWKRIKSEYNVLANVSISGDDYGKYGTHFDNQILVIDKTGPTDNTLVTGFAKHFEDLPLKLQEIRNARQPANVQTDQRPAGEQPGSVKDQGAGQLSQPTRNPRPSTPSDNAGTKQPRPKSPRSGGSGARTSEPDRSGQLRPEEGGRTSGLGKPADIGPDSGTAGPDQRPSDRRPNLEVKSEGPKKKAQISDSIFESYHPAATVAGAQPHPTPLVESAAMSDTQPPKAVYVPDLPKHVVEGGPGGTGLSAIQLEAVVYAGQSHRRILRDGRRRGFFIGDGTGVGKGREISGIIHDNWRQGREKAVWVSESWGLLKDAERDLKDSGWKEGAQHLFSHKPISAGSQITKRGKGILFTTYSTLRTGFKNYRDDEQKTHEDMTIRLNQVVDWLGPDFDGVIAFDESHNMANAAPQKGERGVKPPSQQALAGIALQRRLPKARVVYISATGATEVENLIYADRLGLWGEGTTFGDARSFVNSISSGGIATMELVARNLKSLGLYLARSLSYAEVTYDRLVHKLDTEQQAKYNELARAWQVVLHNIDRAIEITGSDKASANLSAFWGAHQRFFNQIVTTLQMPSAIEAIKKDVDNGHAVVIQLVNTDEAQQTRALSRREQGQELEDLDMTPRENLMAYLEHSFPVQQFEEYTDENGNIRKRPVFDSNGEPVINRQALRIRDEMLERVGAIVMPSGPLEYLTQQLGHENIAEVTGRGRRIVINSKNGRMELEKRSDKIIASEVDDFVNDKRQILVFSGKGATGRSFHADRRYKNQRPRVHYLVQPGWRADKAVQGLGRTHRSNQASAPKFVMVTTDLKGQARFISSIARRLDQLGALTKGERKTGSQGIFQARDNLESIYAFEALDRLINGIAYRRDPMAVDEFERQTGLKLVGETGLNVPHITKFLNRLLSMEIEQQNAIFQAFSDHLDEVVQEFAERGALDVGVETISGASVKKASEQIVFRDDDTGAETKYVQIDVTNPTDFLDYGQAQEFFIDPSGFYQNVRSGKVYIAGQNRSLRDSTGSSRLVRSLINPMKNRQIKDLDEIEDTSKWRKLTKTEAKKLWTAEYEKLPATITKRHHLLTGNILPIWDRIEGKTTVYRMQDDDGNRYIGRVIPAEDLQRTMDALDIAAGRVEIPASDIYNQVMFSNARVRLEAGWALFGAKVSGEDRIELRGPTYADLDWMRQNGVIIEKIQYQTRYFVPTNGQAEGIIKKIINRKAVVSVDVYAGPRLDGSRFSRRKVQIGGPRMPAADLRKTVLSKIKGWENAPTVHVVQSQDELPISVFDALASQQGEYDPDVDIIDGVYHQGAVYLVADNLTEETVISTLLHESFGHLGLRGVMGDAIDDTLRGIYQANSDEIAQVARDYGLDLADEINQLRATEEWLARLSVKQPHSTWIGRVVAAIREWLRKWIPNLHYTDTEIRELLARARRFVQGRAGRRRAAPAFDQASAYERAKMAEKWHSQMVNVISQRLTNGPAKQVKATLQSWVDKGQIKAEELEWSGLMEWLAERDGKVTRKEVLDYLAANHVQIEEKEKGGDYSQEQLDALDAFLEEQTAILMLRDSGGQISTTEAKRRIRTLMEQYKEQWGFTDIDLQKAVYNPYDQKLKIPTKYSNWQLPGGENYRELLLTLPEKDPYDLVKNDIGDWEIRNRQTGKVLGTLSQSYSEEGARRAARYYHQTDDTANFQASHWDEPNVLTHVRFNERTGANGDRVLFIEEIQSDWHQQGRKKGYGESTTPYGWADTGQASRDKVPDAPFKKTWPILAIKRMVRYAAENGFDAIAWTPGEVQAERYDLSKQVDEIQIAKQNDKYAVIARKDRVDILAKFDLSGSQLEDYVGKDLAKKAISQKNNSSVKYTGEDLKVGGEGMKGFYDRILPAEVKKFFGKKAWGNAKVSLSEIESEGKHDIDGSTGSFDVWEGMDEDEVMALTGGFDESRPVIRQKAWSLPITPEMRQKALREGMPLFQRRQKNTKRIDHTAILSGEVKKRMDDARGAPEEKLIDKLKETAADLNRERSHFPGLQKIKDKGLRARLHNILRLHQEIPETAKAEAIQMISGWTRGLSKDGFEVYRMNIILADMARDIDKGLLIDGNLPFGFKTTAEVMAARDAYKQLANDNDEIRQALDERAQAVNGLRDRLVDAKLLNREVQEYDDYFHHQVLQYWATKHGLGTSSKDVRTHWRPWMAKRKGSALDYNTDYVEAEFMAVSQQLVQLKTKETLQRAKDEADLYVSLKQTAKQANLQKLYELFPPPMEDPLLPYKRQIAWATKTLGKMAAEQKLQYDSAWQDIVDDMAAEYEMGVEGIEPVVGFEDPRFFHFLSYLVRTGAPGSSFAATIFKAIRARDKFIRDTLGNSFVTWQKLVPEGYTVWKPDPGKGWFWANTVADNIIQRVIAGEIDLEDRHVRQVLAKGRELIWVIPDGLAETLDNFREPIEPRRIGRAADYMLSAWKQFVLLNPYSVIKYNVNNFSGDLDIVMAYKPAIAKHAAKAARDLWRWANNKELDPNTRKELEEARRLGVIGSGWSVQEVKDVIGILGMDGFVKHAILQEPPKRLSPKKWLENYWNFVRQSTAWRENILRLAAYRYFVANQNKRLYGASNPIEINSLEGNEKAAKLARELLGDYGDLSKTGEYIRRRLIPFYSWLEINAPRYAYMMRNLKYEDAPGGTGPRLAAVGSKKLVAKGLGLALRVNILFAAVMLWNMTFFPDEEEEMGESGRRQLHIILGRNSDGSILSIRFQGALSDALSFFGLEDWPSDIKDVTSGKMTVGEKLVAASKDAGLALLNKGAQAIRPEIKLFAELASGYSLYPDVARPIPIRDRVEHALRTFKLDSVYRGVTGRPVRGMDGKTGIAARAMQHLANDIESMLAYDTDPGIQAYYDTRSMVFDWKAKQGDEKRYGGRPTNKSNALYWYKQAMKFGDLDAANRYLKKYYELGGTAKGRRQSVKMAHPLSGIPAERRHAFRQSLSPAEEERLQMAVAWYKKTYFGKELDNSKE